MKMKIKIWVPKFIGKWFFPNLLRQAEYLESIGREGVAEKEYRHPASEQPIMKIEVRAKSKKEDAPT